MTQPNAPTTDLSVHLTIRVAVATQRRLDALTKAADVARKAASAADLALANARRDAAAGVSPAGTDMSVWCNDVIRDAADMAALQIDGRPNGPVYWRLHAHPLDRQVDDMTFFLRLFPGFDPTVAVKHGHACHVECPGATLAYATVYSVAAR